MAGRSRSASELAAAAGISRATASFHLARLLDANLVDVQSRGRHRHYALSCREVADAIEALQRISPPAQIRSLRASSSAQALAEARFCYDHLAGRLAIDLVDAMGSAGLITLAGDKFEVSKKGACWLDDLEVDLPSLRASRRSFARACMDWTERKPHLAGAVGAALAGRFLQLGWIERAPQGRAIRVTAAGRDELRTSLGVKV